MAWSHTNTPVLVNAASATVSGAYGSNVTVGDLLCGTSANLGTATACALTDTVGTSYTVLPVLSPTGMAMVAFFGIAHATGANTVQAVWSGGTPGIDSNLIAEEFTGSSSLTPFDKSVTGTGSSGAISAGNITPAQSAELIFVVGGKVVSTAFTVGTGYTGVQFVDSGTTLSSGSQYQIQTTATTTATAFAGAAAVAWGCIAIAFYSSALPQQTVGNFFGSWYSAGVPVPQLMTSSSYSNG